MENTKNTENRICDEIEYIIGDVLKKYLYDYISPYKFRQITYEIEHVLNYILPNNRDWIYRFDYVMNDSRIDEYIVHFTVDTDYIDMGEGCFLTGRKYIFSLCYNDYDSSLSFKRIK